MTKERYRTTNEASRLRAPTIKMRWFIDVASSSRKDAPEQWVVEAAQWQPALQVARSLRGDPESMSGFSIELLENGYRAIDPSTMVRYMVRPAPDGTPVSHPIRAVLRGVR